MENKITGRVEYLSSVEKVGANDTLKQTIVIEETGQKYPQSVVIDALKDSVDQLKGLKVGDELTAYFNLRSREYNGRWYQNVNLWKVEKLDAGDNSPRQAEPIPPGELDDNLPF